MASTAELYVAPEIDDLSAYLEHIVSEIAKDAIRVNGRFSLALSGGSLPKILSLKLKDNKELDFNKWHVFFADERCVPLDSEDSNYKLTKEELLIHVPIPSNQVYTIEESFNDEPRKAAENYAQQIKSFFGIAHDDIPKFDAIFLGMGPDGHTCSLFPNHSLINVRDRMIASITDSPKPPPNRITMTYPILNSAKNVIFVVTGEGKADAMHKIFDLKENLPAGLGEFVNSLLFFFFFSLHQCIS